jgi:aspartate kinase
MIVMKFGGTSVGSAERYKQVAQLVGSFQDQQPVVVVSAMAKTTDWLLNTARTLLTSTTADGSQAERAINEFRERYQQVITETYHHPQIQAEVGAVIEKLIQELARFFTGIELLGELSPRTLDATAAFGEKISSQLLAAALREAGFPAQAVSAEELILTDNAFTHARPNMAVTTTRTQNRLLPLIEQNIIPVVTGFIGTTETGITTTIGRNGSDYSASILGAALNAQEIWIWKEVNGVMTADPRLVPGARSLRRLSYAEAGELTYFGSEVVHPRTVRPAIEKGIPIYIKNTFDPAFPGTLIDRPQEETDGVVKAVTSAKNLALITVSGSEVLTVPGVAARVFAVVARLELNVLMISHASSSQDLCFVIERNQVDNVIGTLSKEFEREIEREEIDTIVAATDVVIVAVVGAGMRGSPGVAGRVFSTLGKHGINIIAIAQGSSELNISLAVSSQDEKAAVTAIHEEFISFNGIGRNLRHINNK